MAKILVIKFKNFKKADASVSQVLNSLKVFRSGSYLKSSLGGLFSLGGGGDSTKFYYGEALPDVQPLTLLYKCTIFDREGTPFVTFYSQ